MAKVKYTVILAVHNEQDLIESVLADVCENFANTGSFEIYVSEDGSSDLTRLLVEKAILNNFRIRISPPGPRLGYSKALINGINQSNGEILVFLDGDGQTKTSDVLKLISHVRAGKFVVGYREKRMDGRVRDIYSKLFKFVYILLGFPNLRDPSAGTVIGLKKDFEKFSKKKLFLPFGFWWEFQAWAHHNQFKIVELPIPHFAREVGETKVYISGKILKIAFTHILGLVKLKIQLMGVSKENQVKNIN